MATLSSIDIQFKKKEKNRSFLCLNIVTKMSVQIFNRGESEKGRKINGTLNRSCCKGKMTCKTIMNQNLFVQQSRFYKSR